MILISSDVSLDSPDQCASNGVLRVHDRGNKEILRVFLVQINLTLPLGIQDYGRQDLVQQAVRRIIRLI